MGVLAFDLRDALRSFRRDKAYAATVILTLALTIGATTAVFSIVNGVLLKPLAYRESHRLVSLREVWKEFADRAPTLEVNERHFNYWREHAASFDALAQYIVRSANLTGRGEAAQIAVAHSSGTLFDVLLTPAALGRTLTAQDDPEGTPNVTTVSDAFWRERLGADPRIVGQAIILDGTAYTVVGVLPPGFQLPDSLSNGGEVVDAYIPLRVNVGWTGDHNDQAIGRLREGVTVDQARAELDVLQVQVSKIASDEGHETVTLTSSVRPLTEQVVGTARRGLLLLLAAIVAVLLIACSNLANLSLTRTLGRLREAAIRSALGASRGRLIAKALLEQLVLSAAGGALGLWLAGLALGLLFRTAPIDLPRVHDVTLDARVLAFAAFVSMFAGAFVAIVPAWRMAGRDVQAALRANVAAVASDRRAVRSHAALLTLQIALSVTLLVVTALLGTSLMRVLHVDRGFIADRVLAVDLSLPGARYAEEPTRQAAYDRLLAALRAVPGVERATTTSRLPLSGSGTIMTVVPDGSAPRSSEKPTANFRFVAPEFFQTLGIGLQRGRTFSETERDPNRPAPVVLSAPTAERLWPGQDPIGKRFSRGLGPREQNFEVVGVVADVRITSLDRTPPLMVYVPYWWRSRAAVSLLIKTTVEPTSLLPAVRRAVHEVDPEIAIGDTHSLTDLVDAAVASRRYQTQLFIAFGAVALFIATVGVYAVTAYGVSRRRREMNIRVALGAQAGQVTRMVLRQATMPVMFGVAAGALAAIASGGVVASLLFEVQARDPMIVAIVVTLVGIVGLATCALATRRGLSLNPAAALRDE